MVSEVYYFRCDCFNLEIGLSSSFIGLQKNRFSGVLPGRGRGSNANRAAIATAQAAAGEATTSAAEATASAAEATASAGAAGVSAGAAGASAAAGGGRAAAAAIAVSLALYHTQKVIKRIKETQENQQILNLKHHQFKL